MCRCLSLLTITKSVINTRTKEKPTPRGGFFFGYMMDDSNRGSYTRRKPRARHFFLVYYLKRNAVSYQARHVVAGFAELATIFLFHKQIIFINKSSHRLASPLLLSAIHSASLRYRGRSRASRAYHGHTRIFCSLVNAFATKICRCQPFAGKSVINTRTIIGRYCRKSYERYFADQRDGQEKGK